MKNAKLNFYFFGDIGEYDVYNPAYVCNKRYASEIVYLIAKNDPFSISQLEITKLLGVNKEEVKDIIDNLKLINAIENKNDKYKIKFPIFLKEDVIDLESYINNIGKEIGNKIIKLRDILYEKVSKLKCFKQYGYERILYHIICDYIFDGTAFEFFKEKNIFCVSKIQPDNRDYIIVAYEDNNMVEKYSNNILCSSNNYRSHGVTFNSFGDSNGIRKDMFRFFRLIQKSVNEATPFEKVNLAYNRILDSKNIEISYECGTLMNNIFTEDVKYVELSEKEKNLAQFLKELGYIDINISNSMLSVNVPVFYDFEISTIIKEISDLILTTIFPIVKETFDNFEINVRNLTSVKHGVNIKEIANEIWHQVFGNVNEYLVKQKFVSVPDNIKGEGRYLRSIIISKNNIN
ncbi:hypothetical protein [Hathewaya limosa]|uniref:Alkaline shock family protein YloU n=1 Tax=Hathewaya limosa TaxID=1536 RepID=A0ABU0JVS1_HATLI|nr:hypothetical protein [Hathewaya limosa]MDQ0480233.1 putative alkaline shock family protein YloU [Hathewaya limosa]